MKNCYTFFHNWEKWNVEVKQYAIFHSPPYDHYVYGKPDLSMPNMREQVTVQTRTCSKCGLTQHKSETITI